MAELAQLRVATATLLSGEGIHKDVDKYVVLAEHLCGRAKGPFDMGPHRRASVGRLVV